jgi:hypothetical protein
LERWRKEDVMTRSQKLVLATLVGAALIFAGVATGVAFTNSQNVIHACVNVENGQVRLLDVQSGQQDRQQCRANETAIDWNQSGPAGTDGPAGVTGPAGSAGADGVSGYEVVTSTSPTVGSNAAATAVASCPTGKRPVGGGIRAPFSQSPYGVLGWQILSSFPDGSGWSASAMQNYTTQGSFTVYAVCVKS